MDQIKDKEMEKIVRDAGMYEENMSREEIVSYYEAITNSKTTATTENESRDISQIDEAFEELVPNKIDSKRNSIIDDGSNDVEVEELDACKANITFNDMQNMPKEKYLQVSYHPLKYVNIQNSKRFLDANADIKAKMLYSYHTKTAKLKSLLSRQSFFTVPLPKPIILREMHITPLSFDTDGIDTYISRSGRQTKRKIYNEDDDSNSGILSTKKQKNVEVGWQSKSKPLRGPVSKVYETELNKTQNSDSPLMASSTPKSIPNRTKRLTNAEILAKSKLFNDLPPKLGTPTSTKAAEQFLASIPKSKKLSRSEEMFEKLFKETEKKQKEEKAMEDFEESLEVSDEETLGRNEPESEDIINIVDDEPAKRRIVPPTPPLKRRNIHTTSNSSKPLIDTAESSKKENCLSKKKGKPKNESTKSSGDVVLKKNDNEPEGVPCPLCNNNFPLTKIQAHAATCGEEAPEAPKSPRYTTRQNLMCHICDCVFVANYDEHVKECINLHKKLDKN